VNMDHQKSRDSCATAPGPVFVPDIYPTVFLYNVCVLLFYVVTAFFQLRNKQLCYVMFIILKDDFFSVFKRTVKL